MVSEFRRLVFTRDDILKAILLYNRLGSVKLPSGDIMTMKMVNEPEPTIFLDIHDASSDITESVELKSNYIAAVMIRYCIENHVPIARNSEKHIEVCDNRLALCLSMNAGHKTPAEKIP